MKQNRPNPIELRHIYLQAALKQSGAKDFAKLTEQINTTDDPVLVCYKGVSMMISAKYGNNPFAKLRKFNTGKALMDSAIARDNDNVEMRYLRYAIQKSAPEFLGYHKNLSADEYFLKSRQLTIKDHQLKEMVLQVLTEPVANKG